MQTHYWPQHFPSPSEVYDALIKYGSIHHVIVRSRDLSFNRGSQDGTIEDPWDVEVQFFQRSSADKLETMPQDEVLFGCFVWVMCFTVADQFK